MLGFVGVSLGLFIGICCLSNTKSLNTSLLMPLVNDKNENMINKIIPAIKVILNALVNVFIVDLGTAAIIVVIFVVSLARELMPTFTISVNEENNFVAEAIIMTMTKGIMK